MVCGGSIYSITYIVVPDINFEVSNGPVCYVIYCVKGFNHKFVWQKLKHTYLKLLNYLKLLYIEEIFYKKCTNCAPCQNWNLSTKPLNSDILVKSIVLNLHIFVQTKYKIYFVCCNHLVDGSGFFDSFSKISIYIINSWGVLSCFRFRVKTIYPSLLYVWFIWWLDCKVVAVFLAKLWQFSWHIRFIFS